MTPQDHAQIVNQHLQSVNITADFCSVWPQAKQVLGLVAGFIQWIPGAGVVPGQVLNGLIQIGDNIARQVCQPSS